MGILQLFYEEFIFLKYAYLGIFFFVLLLLPLVSPEGIRKQNWAKEEKVVALFSKPNFLKKIFLNK